VAYEDAVEWCAAGCLSYVIPHCNLASKISSYIIIPKVFEIALNNGVDPRTGIQTGPKTGDVTKFTSIEQLYEAFWKQYDYFATIATQDYTVGYNAKIEHLGTPVTALIIEDCLKRGLDVYEGGERYPSLGNNIGMRGCLDVADSLAAIKKLVFDDKKITMEKLMAALKANWEGYEDVHQMCLKAPKYGNDDDYADDIFNHVSLKCNELIMEMESFQTRSHRTLPCRGSYWRSAERSIGQEAFV
jgi:formate C-acetyltransferase